jgi:hypothetical protein
MPMAAASRNNGSSCSGGPEAGYDPPVLKPSEALHPLPIFIGR